MGTLDAMREIFDVEATIDYALAFEAALARGRSSVGLVSFETAEAIAATCGEIEVLALAEVIARVRAELPAEVAREVHVGATAQDVSDTVLAIQTLEAAEVLRDETARLGAALVKLADRFAQTPALDHARALPISFGLRIAQWFAGIDNAAERLATEVAASCKVQLGGAAGTRAGLGGQGAKIAQHMATALGLQTAVPWHSRRVGLVAIASALGIEISALGKMASDLAVLAVVGEVTQVRVEAAHAAAARAPGLVAAALAGAEGVVPELFVLAAGSCEALRIAAVDLEVHAARVLANLVAANVGRELGEAAAIVSAILAHHAKG